MPQAATNAVSGKTIRLIDVPVMVFVRRRIRSWAALYNVSRAGGIRERHYERNQARFGRWCSRPSRGLSGLRAAAPSQRLHSSEVFRRPPVSGTVKKIAGAVPDTCRGNACTTINSKITERVQYIAVLNLLVSIFCLGLSFLFCGFTPQQPPLRCEPHRCVRCPPMLRSTPKFQTHCRASSWAAGLYLLSRCALYD